MSTSKPSTSASEPSTSAHQTRSELISITNTEIESHLNVETVISANEKIDKTKSKTKKAPRNNKNVDKVTNSYNLRSKK